MVVRGSRPISGRKRRDLQRRAEQRDHQGGEDEREPEAAGGRQHDDAHIGAQHEQLAVGEVHHVHDAEDQREPGGDQRQDHAGDDAVHRLDEDLVVGNGLQERDDGVHAHTPRYWWMTASSTLQLGRRALVAHDALLHDVDALARLERQRHVLLHQQDRHALAVQHVDDLADLRDHARHQAFGRLVQQDDLGLEHHRAGDRQHLLLAARQRAAGLVAPLGQHREIGEDLVEQLLLARLGHAVAIEAGAQVLHHGEQAEDAPVLGHVADAEPRQLVRRQAGDRLALEQHLALAADGRGP